MFSFSFEDNWNFDKTSRVLLQFSLFIFIFLEGTKG